jgi:3-dehydroquinate synthase
MADVAGEAAVIHQRIAVSFEYPVCFTRNAFAPENPVLTEVVARREPARRHRVFPMIDEGVARRHPGLPARIQAYIAAHPDQLALAAPPHPVPGGEAAKNDPAVLDGLLGRLQAAGMDRQSVVLAVGGGAVLDAVGYAAAITHRGVRLVRMPTTVLGQNDSGVGVKTAINAFSAKNYLGAFAPPFAVVNDFDFLAALEARDRIAGIAEAVKVALIRDAAFFGWLEGAAPALTAFRPAETERMIRRCAELHLAHIAGCGDPFEMGSARPLDYGHWAAHKLETLTHHELRHGEAVAIGMTLDANYAVRVGMLAEADYRRIRGLLARLGFRLWHDALARPGQHGKRAVLAGLDEFREHLGGDLTITLLTGIGRAVEVNEIDTALVEEAILALERDDRAP